MRNRRSAKTSLAPNVRNSRLTPYFGSALEKRVESRPGPAWDQTKRRRKQAGWDEHAAFMDALLVVKAKSEDLVRARLAADPWTGRILTIASVKPWSVWLRAPVRP